MCEKGLVGLRPAWVRDALTFIGRPAAPDTAASPRPALPPDPRADHDGTRFAPQSGADFVREHAVSAGMSDTDCGTVSLDGQPGSRAVPPTANVSAGPETRSQGSGVGDDPAMRRREFSCGR